MQKTSRIVGREENGTGVAVDQPTRDDAVMQAVLITGTDTDVGKTGVAVELLKLLRDDGCRVGALKPAASGRNAAGRWDDADALADAAGVPRSELDRVCPFRYDLPWAPPHAAAGRDQPPPSVRTIDAALAAWRDHCDWLLIEGAGGLLCPIAVDGDRTLTIADLAERWAVPTVTVVAQRLGMISHSLLTNEVMQARGIANRAWVFNNPTPPDDREEEREKLAQSVAEIVSRSPGVAEIVRPFGGDAPLSIRRKTGGPLGPLTAKEATPWFRPIEK